VGVGFGDFDNDGWPDILIANGNFSASLGALPGEARYAEPLQFFRNLGNRTFEDTSESAGLNDLRLQSRREPH
jgi:enediyne biosynthesis protein E4